VDNPTEGVPKPGVDDVLAVFPNNDCVPPIAGVVVGAPKPNVGAVVDVVVEGAPKPLLGDKLNSKILIVTYPNKDILTLCGVVNIKFLVNGKWFGSRKGASSFEPKKKNMFGAL
jgi:hypothetical protein